ncbi:MAG: riboflavin kinase, partial [Candidatus Dormibacteraeota bacterium]|nr:riboflavin kinase [Candidatus Dormibacteraeota bacterium]
NAIYASRVDIDGQNYGGATSIGFRPTFGGNTLTVEAFVLDFNGDLYDKLITVWFLQRLRAEKRFATVEALQRQMARDVENTRRILGVAHD